MVMISSFNRFVALASAVGFALSLPTAQPRIENLVVFGDSLSDDGTGAWTLSNGTWPADPAYVGHRFSNGPVWAETLATSLGWELSDYAVGGATSDNAVVQGATGPGSSILSPSALDQLDKYLKTHPSLSTVSRTLYAVFIGANDALFHPGLDASKTIHGIQTIVSKLRRAGASHFLVVTLPDLATLPFNNYINLTDSSFYHDYSVSFRSQVQALAHSSIDCTLTVVDAYDLFADIFSRPAAYGFDANATHASCLTGVYGEAPRSLCANPEQYVFWDEYHPTQKSHQYIAELAKQTLLK